MSKKFHLKLVTINNSILSDKKNYMFMGKWCEVGIKNKSKIKYQILKNPWLDLNKKEKNYKIVFNQYLKMKKFLTKFLNKIHKTNFSEKYWDQIFGHWLINFISLYQEKKLLIEKIKPNIISYYDFIDLKDNNSVPFNSSQAHIFFQDDYWNGYLFSILISKLKPNIKYKKKIGLIEIKNNNRNKKIFPTIIEIAKSTVCKILSKLSNKKEKFIISSYLGTLNEIKLQLKTNQTIKFNRNLYFENHAKVNKNFRKLKKANIKINSKDLLLAELIVKFLPKSYLENYTIYKSFVNNKTNWPNNPKVIFTSNSHFTNDLFKIWLAEKREKKIKFIVGQHGNGYLFPKYSTPYDRDIFSCDKFLFWGKKKFNNKKIQNNFNLINLNKKITRKNKSNILMVQNFPNKYQNKLISTEHCLSDIYQNIDLQKKFISNLQRDIKSKIKIRLGSYLEKFPNGILQYEREQWDNGGKLDIESRNLSIKKSLINANFVVVNSIISTVFLECLSSNIPCFVISLFNKKMFSKNCYKDFLYLKKVGIIHNDPKSFASLINKNYYKIDYWWNSKQVQEAIRRFNLNYNFSDKSPINSLSSKLN